MRFGYGIISVMLFLAALLTLSAVQIQRLEKEQVALLRRVGLLHSTVDKLDSMLAARRDLKAERDSIVAKEARALGLPVQLALAVAWVENRGADSLAVSRAGALGLMQVMTPSAFQARGDTGQASAREELVTEICGIGPTLYERVCNVQVGLRIYRDYLLRHRNEYRALAAYNGALSYPRAAQRYVTAVRIYTRALTAMGATQ